MAQMAAIESGCASDDNYRHSYLESQLPRLGVVNTVHSLLQDFCSCTAALDS